MNNSTEAPNRSDQPHSPPVRLLVALLALLLVALLYVGVMYARQKAG